MSQKFQMAAYKAMEAKNGTADPTLYKLAESLELIAQGLKEQADTQERMYYTLLNK